MVVIGKFVVSETSGICCKSLENQNNIVEETLIGQGTEITLITVDRSSQYIAVYKNNLTTLTSLVLPSKNVSLSMEKVLYMEFSPLSDHIVVWQSIPIKDEKTGRIGFGVISIFKITDCDESLSLDLIVTFGHPYSDFQEIHWSEDQSLAMCVGLNYVKFLSGAGFKNVQKEIYSGLKGASVCNDNYAVFVNEKNKPIKFIKMFKFYADQKHAPVALRTMSSGESASFYWNKQATCLLVTVTGGISNNSYYGSKTLYFLGTNGDSFVIGDGEKEPAVKIVHAVAWSPTGESFGCITGSLPASLCLYNTKCNLIFKLDPQCRNAIYYNPFGNLICSTAHGNAQGPIEILNVDTCKIISRFKVDYKTDCYWMPDGIHILFSVLAPKLTVYNGFQMWKYTGENIFNYDPGCELWFLRPLKIQGVEYEKPKVISPDSPKDLIGVHAFKKYVPSTDETYGFKNLPPKKPYTQTKSIAVSSKNWNADKKDK